MNLDAIIKNSTSKKSPNFDKVNELELERWSLKQRESFYFGVGDVLAIVAFVVA